eukprot:gene5723-6618_t
MASTIQSTSNSIHQRIESYLTRLHDSVNASAAQSSSFAAIDKDALLIDELSNIVLKELVDDEIGLAASLLFHGDHNLLKYLDRTTLTATKEAAKTKASVLTLVAAFVKAFRGKVFDYALPIKTTCVALFRRDQSPSVQALAFAPLQKLLGGDHHAGDSLASAEVLGVREMTDLFLLQFTCGKLTSTVRAGILITLGLFSERFPAAMFDKHTQLCAIYMETLGSQLKSKAPESLLIHSSLKGLTSLLVHFSGDFTNGPKNVQLLYQYLYVCLEQVPTGARTEVARAALWLVSRHAHILKQYLAEQSEKFFGRLEEWCKHTNKKNRDIAFNTIDVFLAQIAMELTSGSRNADNDQTTFKFFIRKFYAIFENNNSSAYEISIAIRGIGRFALPVKTFIGEWELKSLLGSLFKFSEKLMTVTIDNIDEIVMHLSSFINAFSNILFEIQDLEFWYLDHLEQNIGTYFIIFPYLFTTQRSRYYTAINRLLASLYHNVEFLKTLLGRIVRQGLIITFSKPNESLATFINTGDTPWYEVYKEVWHHLLHPKPTDVKQSLQAAESADNLVLVEQDEIVKLIYNEIIQSIIGFIQKLDLSYSTKSEDDEKKRLEKSDKDTGKDEDDKEEQDEEDEEMQAVQSVEGETLLPSTPKDIELFLNLVEFAKLFIPDNRTGLIVPWIYIFGKEIIYTSKKYPLISGFYKLLQVLMKACRKENYFGFIDAKDPVDRLTASPMDAMQIDQVTNTDKEASDEELENKRNCFILFGKFVKEVEAYGNQFKDELLASCVELLLSVPRQLVNMALLIPTLKTAFKIGLGYLKLGHIALNAIEYWLKVMPSQVYEHLDAILPSLNDYLLIATPSLATPDSPTPTATPRLLPRTKRFGGHGSNIDPKLLQAKNSVEEIQTRIIRLLGVLGGRNIHFLGAVNLLAPGTEAGVAWDSEPRIRLAVPLSDVRIAIYLDNVLPSIVQLAERATHRQAKVAACETLHAILLYMVGTNASAPPSSTSTFHKLYRKIFPALLSLATDVEAVARGLFQPLVFQLIHWFTKNSRHESDETMGLLNAIVDAVGNTYDGSLRDFAGKCLAEFFQWSLKHTSKAQQEKNPFNFKSLLKRIYSLAHHPNPYKRLGAAIAFTEIYRLFREEDALISTFIFEMAHNVLFSLRIGDEADETGEIAVKYSNVLAVFAKVIARKSELLMRANKARREHPDLAHFVGWLFESCGRPEKRARAESMIMFTATVVLLPGITSPATWVKLRIKREGISSVVTVAEPQIAGTKSLPPMEASNLKEIMFWMKRMSTSLNVYLWFLGESYIDATQLASKEHGARILTNAFHVFLTECALVAPPHAIFATMTPKEVDRFNLAKTSVITHTLALFIMLADKYQFLDVLNYGGIQFLRVVAACLLAPQSIGFTSDAPTLAPSDKDTTIDRAFRFPPLVDIISRICLILADNIKFRQSLEQILADKIVAEPTCNLGNIETLVKTEGTDSLVNLVRGYRVMHETGLLASVHSLASQMTPQALNMFLLKFLNDNCANDSPSRQILAKEILSLIFSVGVSPDTLLTFVLAPIVPKTIDKDATATAIAGKDKDKQSTFYKSFFEEINVYVSKHFESFSRLLIKRMASSGEIDKLLNDVCLVKQVQGTPASRKKDMVAVILPFITSIAPLLLKDGHKAAEKESIIEFTKNLIKIDVEAFFGAKEGYDFVYSLLVGYLQRTESLAFKNKALTLLPYLLSYPRHQNYSTIKEKLNEIVVYDFPLVSKDLTIGSPMFLETLEQTANPMIIDTLLQVLKEQDHSHIKHIAAAIDSFIQSTTDNQSKDIFSHCFGIFLNDDYTDELKSTLIDRFCVPLLRHMPPAILVSLFAQHLTSLMAIITPLAPKYLTSPAERKSSLVEKICCFRLIEAFYDALPSTSIRDNVNRYFYDRPDAKGTELTAAIMKAAHSAKSEKLTSDDRHVTRSLCTRYHGAAYAALASVVACTQTKENFFHIFFFKENKDKNEYLWENIIDTDHQYKFEAETNYALSQELAQSSSDNDLKYLSSQYLVDSSLSQDLGGVGKPSANAPVDPEELERSAKRFANLNIEMDEVNANPAMIAMLKIIDIYQTRFPSDPASTDASFAAMPKWMTELYNKASDNTVEPNVLIFIIKVIINRPGYFDRFHALWTPVLLDYVVSPRTGGAGIHYFVRDVCVTLLRWPNIYAMANPSTTIRQTLTRFMRHLFKHTYNQERSLLRNNLNICKRFVERYHGKFTPDKTIIQEYLATPLGSYKGKGRQLRTTGLVLLSILLSNGLPAYDKESDNEISEFKFYQVLLDNLSDFKELYDAASEICGMILNHLHKTQTQSVFNQLLKEKFQLKILNIMPQLSNEIRLIALNIIHWIVDDIPDLFIKLKSSNLENLIKIREEETQLVILKILFKLIKHRDTSSATLTQLINILIASNFPLNPNESCRKPLSECSFKEYVLDASWQNRTSTMNPLFSSSQLDEESSQALAEDHGGIRATQAPQFTLTQSSFSQFYPSGSSQDMDSTFPSQSSQGSSQSQSSQSSAKRAGPNRKDSGAFKVPAPVDARTLEMRNRFKKRDSKTENERNVVFARLAVKRTKDREEYIARTKQARENQITMFRKYRQGELPDIQIKYSELVRPLQSLCQLDAGIGASIFSSLFTAIYETAITGREARANIKKSIGTMAATTQFNASLGSALLKIFERTTDLAPPFPTITKMAGRSGNHPMGIIVIEKMVTELSTGGTKGGRASAAHAQQQGQIQAWDNLRELYAALKEEDIILGLFERQLGAISYTKMALEAELRGDWVQVLKVYDEALSKLESGALAKLNLSARDTALWENGRLECYTKLRDWTALKENFYSYFGAQDDPKALATTVLAEHNKEELLGYYLQFGLKVKENWPATYNFIASLAPEQYTYIEDTFPGELAFLEVTRSDYNRSAYYIQRFFGTFREKWSATHPLAIASRHRILQPLQKIIEVEEFLSLVSNEKRIVNLKSLESLISHWRHRYPSKHDDITTTDDIAENKIKNMLIQERAELYHQMSKGARKLDNIIVSEAYFRLAVKSYPKTKDNDLAFPLVSSLIKIYCMKAKNSNTPVETLDRFVKALKFVESKSDEETINNNPDNLQKYKRLHGDIFWELYQLDRQQGSDVLSESLKKNSIPGYLTTTPVNKLSNELFSSAYKSYSESIQLHAKSSEHSKSAHLQFGTFCDTVLKKKDDPHSESSSMLASSVVNSILTAIKEEIPGAKEKFPRLLEIISIYEKTTVDFKNGIKSIPSWMFIGWMSQIFPYLDLPQGPLVLPILMDIATNYPQAIYFPFKISSEQFGSVAKKLTAPLEQILRHPLLDTLITEFERLTHPEHRFKDFMETVKTMLKATPVDTSALVKLNTVIFNDCFNHLTVTGDYNIKFAKEWENTYIGHFGKDGAKMAKMDAKKLIEIVSDMSMKMNKTMKPTSTATMKLKDFSLWLTEFDRSNFLQDIEIPGQYGGTSKPQPEMHIKISSFDTNLLVMGSLRKPKRIKIHGNDEQDYPFLIKGGEDLRLDQRIQQLFHVMNDILKRDPAASKRGLRVTTYQVVPMTGKVGIIEWLNDTKPLKEILEEQMAVHQKVERSAVSLSRMDASKIHADWIGSFQKYLKGTQSPPGPLYHQMFMHATPSDVTKKQERQHDKIPSNLLQNGIWALSSSPESYLFIRNSFARSLATFSICSYIIGIGDRHLENFLISQKDGRLIGIDFGHAFGTATQFLPIPELMPFRLTRQFTSFLLPLDSVGLLNHNMTYTLAAIQNHKDFLLSTMDVFVKEPLLDWIKLSSRIVKEQGKNKEKAPDNWFPQEKIAIAKKKLERWNPAYLTTEELQSSVHKGQPYEKNLYEIVKGDPAKNARAMAGKICTSAKQQVDCLIDQATDINILGRTWAGWSSWL